MVGSAVVAVAFGVGVAGPAAAEAPCGDWALEMSAADIAVGDVVTVKGVGFGQCEAPGAAPAPAQGVVLSLVQGTTVTEWSIVDAGPALDFEVELAVPAGLGTGQAQLRAAAGAPVALTVLPGAQTSLPVTDGVPELAFTGPARSGPKLFPLAVAGTASLGLGLALVALQRRLRPA